MCEGSPNRIELQGRRVLVTGAARGIGAATVVRLREAGAEVIGVDSSRGYDGLRADVSSADQMARVVSSAGELDVCIANAGVSIMEPLLEGTPESWRAILEVNLLGVLVTFQAAARSMVEHRRGGRLLAVSSIAGLRGETHAAAYSASKAGVIGLVKALAVELAEHRIAVNAVAPGQIETAMAIGDMAALAERLGRPAAELLRDHLERQVPAGRLGQPEEVAALLTFLASGAADFINGEVIRIDGGETAA